MPRKSYEFTRKLEPAEPLDIAPGQTVMEALKRVLHLPSVCSKRFLTTKVIMLFDDFAVSLRKPCKLQFRHVGSILWEIHGCFLSFSYHGSSTCLKKKICTKIWTFDS
jgi:hypothetical protein